MISTPRMRSLITRRMTGANMTQFRARVETLGLEQPRRQTNGGVPAGNINSYNRRHFSHCLLALIFTDRNPHVLFLTFRHQSLRASESVDNPLDVLEHGHHDDQLQQDLDEDAEGGEDDAEGGEEHEEGRAGDQPGQVGGGGHLEPQPDVAAHQPDGERV